MSHHMTKQTKWHVRPAKTQISLGIRPAWSETSLCAQWVAKDPRFLHADSEDSDQTGRMPRLIWVFAGCTSFCWFSHAAAHISKQHCMISANWRAQVSMIFTTNIIYKTKWNDIMKIYKPSSCVTVCTWMFCSSTRDMSASVTGIWTIFLALLIFSAGSVYPVWCEQFIRFGAIPKNIHTHKNYL